MKLKNIIVNLSIVEFFFESNKNYVIILIILTLCGTIMPNHTDTRAVIEDYEYTTHQMENVGRFWEHQAVNRLFVSCGERIKRTGLTLENIQNIKAHPYSIMLPINTGSSHWVSLAVKVTMIDGKRHIKMSYSNSLGNGNLPAFVQAEMNRIAELFLSTEHCQQNAPDFTREVYPHLWRQNDGCSCGPYALKNAERCLDNKGKEANPGRKAIREEQLNMMIEPSAIRGCSTNNEIDAVLINWVYACLSQNKPYDNIRESADVEEIILQFVRDTGADMLEIERKFRAEYSVMEGQAYFYRPVIQRMRELIATNELVHKIVEPSQLEAQRKLFREENVAQRMENIRKIIEQVTNSNLISYVEMANIVENVSKMNVAEAVAAVTRIVTEPKLLNACLLDIANATGSRRLENEYSSKLASLAKSYRSIAKSRQTILDNATLTPDGASSTSPGITPKTIEQDAPTRVLDDHIVLLNAAIQRNDDSLMRQVAFMLVDFCSSIIEFLTYGYWEPNFKRIQEIKFRLANRNDIPVDKLSNKDYELERDSIQRLLDARRESTQVLDLTLDI